MSGIVSIASTSATVRSIPTAPASSPAASSAAIVGGGTRTPGSFSSMNRACLALRSAKQARFMDEKLPGVRVPPPTIAALEAAGEDAGAVGMDLTVALVEAIETIPDIAGIHVMAMGHDAVTRDLVERTGLFPRPTV